MNIFDSAPLMKCNPTEIFGNIIFKDAAQTEKIVFTDFDNNVIFEKEYPLGTSFIQSCNCGINIFNQLKRDLLNYTINITTGETLQDIAIKLKSECVLNDRFLLLEIIDLFGSKDKHSTFTSEVRLLYEELCNIAQNCSDKSFLLGLNVFLKNGYIKLYKQNPLLWYYLSFDDAEFIGALECISFGINDKIIGFSDSPMLNEIVFKVFWERILEQLFKQLLFFMDTSNFYKGYINDIDYICNNDFKDYLNPLNNMQRTYLYLSNSKEEYRTMSDVKYSGIFEFSSSKTISVCKNIDIDNLSLKEQAKMIKECNIELLESVDLYNIQSLFAASMTKIIENNIKVKRCKNCQKYFIPYTRSDTMYCDEPAPQNPTKSCKEYASQELYYEKIKSNPASKLHRKIYQQKQMLAKRNPDIEEYKIDFENFKTAAKKWKRKVKGGTAAESDYLQWLTDVKEKKVK